MRALAIVGCLTALLGLTAAAGAQAPPAGGVAAVVNGEPIPLAQVEAEMQRRPPTLAPLPAEQQRQLRHELLNDLIDEMVMRQFLKKNGPAVSSSDVDKQLAALQTAQVAVGKSLGDYYRDTQQTEEQVRTNIHQAVQLDRYVQARTTPAELDKYFQANKEFFDKVTVRCRHIVLRVPSAASPAEREAIRQQLLGLRQQITAGQLDFAEAARKYSACPSAAGGGDIGYLVRKWMPVDEAILKTAFALKVGEVSEPVQSEVGLHLLQVTERSPGTPVTLDQCLPAVRESYQAELKQAVLVEQRQLAKVEIRLP